LMGCAQQAIARRADSFPNNLVDSLLVHDFLRSRSSSI
jgi:hypothetical protein